MFLTFEFWISILLLCKWFKFYFYSTWFHQKQSTDLCAIFYKVFLFRDNANWSLDIYRLIIRFWVFFLCFILHLNIFLYFYFSLLSYNEHFEHMSPPSTLCHSETCVFLNSSKRTATKCWAKVTLLETSIYYNANQELLDIKYHHSKMLWVFSEMNYYFNLEPLIKSLNYSQSDYEAFIRFSQNL